MKTNIFLKTKYRYNVTEQTPNQKGGKMKKYEISHSKSAGEADLYLIWDVTGKERELLLLFRGVQR